MNDEDPSLVLAQDGSLYLAWFSARTASGDIYVMRTQEGTAWSAPVRVTTSTAGDFNPHLIQDSQGAFHLTWFRWDAPFHGSIYYNTSPDGMTWNPAAEVRVTNMPDVDDWVPTIVGRPDGTLLVYFASALRGSGVTDLYLARRLAGQSTWLPVVPVTGLNSAGEHDHLPHAARIGTGVSLTWVRHDTSEPLPWMNTKSDVYYAASVDGLQWAAPVRVTTEVGRVVNLFPGFYLDATGSWSLNWLSTRSGSPEVFETPISQAGQYPQGVAQIDELGNGYSHRIVQAEDDVYLGVWVAGDDNARDLFYRFFER